jgi:hypothetical protein
VVVLYVGNTCWRPVYVLLWNVRTYSVEPAVVFLYCMHVQTTGNALPNSHLQFITLQQNIDMIKVETDVDIRSEEDPIGMEAEEVHIPSPFSVKDEELKVSHVFRCFLWLLVVREREWMFVCMCACMFFFFAR